VQVQVGGRISNSLEIPQRGSVAPDLIFFGEGTVTDHSHNSDVPGARVILHVSITDGKVTGQYKIIFPHSQWDFSAGAVATLQGGVLRITDTRNSISLKLPNPGQTAIQATEIAMVHAGEGGPLIPWTTEIVFNNFTLDQAASP
jgi:hypothetical protein